MKSIVAFIPNLHTNIIMDHHFSTNRLNLTWYKKTIHSYITMKLN